jgi:hypothetical protein
MSHERNTGERAPHNDAIILPVPHDKINFVSAYLTNIDEDEDEEPREVIMIRSRREPGFVPHYLFEKAMRWMLRKRVRRDGDPMVERVSEDEYKFYARKCTLKAKRVRGGVAMVAVIDLRQNSEGRILKRKFNSATCRDIRAILKLAEVNLLLYDFEPITADEIGDEERSWLMSHDMNFEQDPDVEEILDDADLDEVEAAAPAEPT